MTTELENVLTEAVEKIQAIREEMPSCNMGHEKLAEIAIIRGEAYAFLLKKLASFEGLGKEMIDVTPGYAAHCFLYLETL